METVKILVIARSHGEEGKNRQNTEDFQAKETSIYDIVMADM